MDVFAQRREAEKARIMKMLGNAQAQRQAGDPPRKLAAIDLAPALDAGRKGDRERKRRVARDLIHELREDGEPILSDDGGYWLGQDAEDFSRAQEFARRNCLARLSLASKIAHQPAAADAKGHLGMFG